MIPAELFERPTPFKVSVIYEIEEKDDGFRRAKAVSFSDINQKAVRLNMGTDFTPADLADELLMRCITGGYPVIAVKTESASAVGLYVSDPDAFGTGYRKLNVETK